MLSTIAQLSDTTVFANSDSNGIIQYPWWPQANPTDHCLEFGVGPDGYQVSYDTLDRKAWDIRYDDGHEVELHVDPQGERFDLQRNIESNPAFSTLLVYTKGEVPSGGRNFSISPGSSC